MHRFIVFGLAITGFLAGCAQSTAPEPYAYSCDPSAYEILEIAEFENAEDHVLDLADCLRDTDPAIRDGKAYEGLTAILRSGTLPESSVRDLQTKLLDMLKADDPSAVTAPFAALVLSEVARVDRVSPYLTEAERTAFVQAAANYVSGVSDYRGFTDGDGWRHGVAHGADWLMQLTLNPNVSDADLGLIRDAVAGQVRSDGTHAYIHGEAARLARPVLFIARRGVYDQADWDAWFAKLSAPAPLESWNDAFKSEAGLAQRHNLNAFLNVLYVNADLSEDENIRAILPGTLEAIKVVP